jgi:hypothetical protein
MKAQSLGPYGLQVQSCKTGDRSGAGPAATAVTVGTDSGGNVLVGGMTYFEEVVKEDGDFVDNCVGTEDN